MGLLVIVLLLIATLFLVRSMDSSEESSQVVRWDHPEGSTGGRQGHRPRTGPTTGTA